jgi:hypothetical protein
MMGSYSSAVSTAIGFRVSEDSSLTSKGSYSSSFGLLRAGLGASSSGFLSFDIRVLERRSRMVGDFSSSVTVISLTGEI